MNHGFGSHIRVMTPLWCDVTGVKLGIDTPICVQELLWLVDQTRLHLLQQLLTISQALDSTRIMPYCMVFGCKNDSKDPTLLKVWLAKLRLEDPPIKETSRVCSEHYADECFKWDLKSELMSGAKPKRTLKPNAVPTLFSFVKSSKRSTSTKRIKEKDAKQVSFNFG